MLILAMKMPSSFTTDFIFMNTEVCNVTSKPSQTNSRCILSFKNSSTLLKGVDESFKDWTHLLLFWDGSLVTLHTAQCYVHLSISISIYLPVYLSVYLSLYIYLCIYIHILNRWNIFLYSRVRHEVVISKICKHLWFRMLLLLSILNSG